MGIVVLADDDVGCRRVAVKILASDASKDDELRERFLREATAAMKLRSEHVVRVLDVGEIEAGVPFIVMEYLEGANLSELLKGNGPLPVEVVVEYLLQACEGVAEAHAVGIIHRDLKPSNLFLTSRSDGSTCVKVLDFGVSKVRMGQGRLALTADHSMLGSPFYMSPEQMTSPKDVDERADVWALGVSIYQLVTGRLPFSAPTASELYIRMLTTTPPSLRERRPDVPLGLDATVLRCLEKDREARFANVAELAAALLPFGPARVRRSVEVISALVSSARVLPGATVRLDGHPGMAEIHRQASARASERPSKRGRSSRPAPVQERSPWTRRVVLALGVIFMVVLGMLAGSAVSRCDAEPVPAAPSR
jgi:serine/threonine-protein kinase